MMTHRMRGLLISVLLVTAVAEMRRMFLWLWMAVASLGIALGLMAAEPPEPLDCTAEDGDDAESVRRAQNAQAAGCPRPCGQRLTTPRALSPTVI